MSLGWPGHGPRSSARANSSTNFTAAPARHAGATATASSAAFAWHTSAREALLPAAFSLAAWQAISRAESALATFATATISAQRVALHTRGAWSRLVMAVSSKEGPGGCPPRAHREDVVRGSHPA